MIYIVRWQREFYDGCSSWRETSQGTCVAPSTYTGECSSHIDARGMTNADKQSFGIQCGARSHFYHRLQFVASCFLSRWPCLGGQEHEYTSTCPNGWTLQPGQTCNAPDTYTGKSNELQYRICLRCFEAPAIKSHTWAA